MFCSHCGKKIPDGSEKCPDCGAEVKQPAPEKKENFLEKTHPCTLTALLISGVIAILSIFNIVFMARQNPTVLADILLYAGIAAFILSLFGYQKSEKNANDKLYNLISLASALFAILMSIISYIVWMALLF